MSSPDDPDDANKPSPPSGRGQAPGSRMHRFAKGDGRPRPGRKKGSKDLSTIIRAIGDIRVPVVESGRRSTVDTKTAILMAARTVAIKGNLGAIKFLTSKFEASEITAEGSQGIEDLLAEDKAILDLARERGLVESQTNDATHSKSDADPDADKGGEGEQ